MHWEFVAALLLAIPIISLPLVLWYSDIGRAYTAIYKAKKRRTGNQQERPAVGAGQREAAGHQS